MSDDTMPRNLVGTSHSEQIDHKAWRAHNLPACPLTVRWRYANRQIPLFERRLRSLAGYHVGPALQAWVRSRLGWIVGNKLRACPDGVIVLTLDPQGDVNIVLESLRDAPAFTVDDLCWEHEVLVGTSVPGTLWAARDDALCAIGTAGTSAVASTNSATDTPTAGGTSSASAGDAGDAGDAARGASCLLAAADTLVRDLATTLGNVYLSRTFTHVDIDGVELFAVNDEHGVIVCEGHEGPVSAKLSACFEKLWNLNA